MKKVYSLLALAGSLLASKSPAISLDNIQLWTGSGTNRAALVVEWNSPVGFLQTSLPAPVATKTMVWGYRFNGTVSGSQLLNAVVAADHRLYAVEGFFQGFGYYVSSIGYNLDGTGYYGLSDGTNTYLATNFANGLLINPTLNIDSATNLDAGDLYWGATYGPNWVSWNELGFAGGFTNSPNRGSSQYYDPNSGNHGQWSFSESGLDGMVITNGSWLGFTVGGDAYPDDTNHPGDLAIYNADEQAPPDPDGNYAVYVVNTNDFASQVVNATNLSSSGLYNNPAAILGSPTLKFVDNSGPPTTNRVSIVDPPFNLSPSGQQLLTVVNNGGEITVNLGRKVYDDPGNPYGTDFIIYGNSLFSSSTGFVSDSTDFTTATVSQPYGGHTNIVSVSQDGTNWYVYSNAAVMFPTEAYRWDETNQSWTDEQFNPTKPVNPTAFTQNFVGTTLAGTVDQLNGAAGGTGYSIKPSGLPWIQYIRVQPLANSTTVLDAIAVVKPVVVGDALSLGPTNLAAGITNLTFRKQDGTSNTLISLDFGALSDVAKVSTITLSDFTSFAPAYGNVSSAYQITAKPQSGAGQITYAATVRLRAGQNYSGSGSNLVVYQWSGTNWTPQSFVFDPASQEVRVSGVTNLSAFVVSQVSAPQLGIATATNSDGFQFTPMPGVPYTLQRSVDLHTWTNVASITPANSQMVNLQDNSPPPGKAFYRLLAP